MRIFTSTGKGITRRHRGGALLHQFTRFSLLFLFFVPLSGLWSQDLPDPNRCVSQDMEITKAELTGLDPCFTCAEGDIILADLKLTLFNKTGSERTSFAFWGTLNVTDSDGNTQAPIKISGCSGPVEGKTEPTLTFPDKISYVCGTTLTITDIYLAWTDASDNDNRQCPLESSEIAPKCATRGTINVIPPLFVVIDDFTNVTCKGDDNGTINIFVRGGEGPYTFDWADIPGTNDPEDRSGLAPGTYSVIVKDQTGCTVTSENVVITEPDEEVTVSGVGTDVTCYGLDDGTIEISGSGYTRLELILNSSVIADETDLDVDGKFTGLEPGTYVVKAYADGGDGEVDACTDETGPIIIDEPDPNDAGLDGDLTVCSSDTTVYSLIAELGGTPQTGGTWTAPGGGSFDGTFNASEDAEGTYTYTVDADGEGPCPADSSIVEVDITPANDAGLDGDLTVCSSDTTVYSLIAELGGTPQTGGTWTAPGGGAFDGTFNASEDTEGTYTYTVDADGEGPCPADSSIVEVDITPANDAGLDGDLTVCSSDTTVYSLIAELGGTPQTGGTWTAPGGGSFDGTFNASEDAEGTYTYTVDADGEGPCPADSSIVEVDITPANDAGLDGDLTVCSSDTTVYSLIAELDGTPQTGGTWTAPGGGAFDGTFNASEDAEGTYTYTVDADGEGPCPADSSIVEVDITPANDAGLDGDLTVCASDTTVYSLFAELGGTPQTGGTWTAPGGGAFDGTFNASEDTEGTYTYTVDADGEGPCPADSSIVEVDITPANDAGLDGDLTVCSSDTTVYSLFAELGGTPQTGGTWTAPGGGAFDGTFNASEDAEGTYTYTVDADGEGPCPADSSIVEVDITPANDAGLDGDLTVCASDTTVYSLFAELGGTPQTGGTWTAPGGGSFDGTFNASEDAEGTYTYTVDADGEGPCPADSSIVEVDITPANDAGLDGDLTVCASDTTVYSLFAELGGTPQTGGTWTAPGGGSFDSTFNASEDAEGTYTYTVDADGEGPCPADSSIVEVDITPANDAGLDGDLTVCASDTTVYSLFAELGGTPQTGGTWTAPGGGSFDGTFNASEDAEGTYTYTVDADGEGPCPADSSIVEVDITPANDAGLDGDLTVCSSDTTVYSLIAELGGTPQTGGTWTAPGGGSFDGTFNASEDAEGTYTYTVDADGEGPCPADSSIVEVDITPANDAGLDGDLTVCSSDTTVYSLIAELGGTPQTGGTWTAPGGGSFDGTFNASEDAEGTYTYTVDADGEGPCPADSSIVEVDITPANDAGLDGDLTVCASDTTVYSLIAELGGTPQTGGTWTAPGGGSFDGTFNASEDAEGTYTYTVDADGEGPCPADSSIVEVDITPANDAGLDGDLTVCASDTTVYSLFAELGGTPQTGGTWTAPGGGSFDGTFNASEDAEGTYTYTVDADGEGPCPADSSIVEVDITPANDAGLDGDLTVCASDTTVYSLFAELGGTPQTGGTWTAPGGGAFDGTFNASEDAEGTYTYTVDADGEGPCPADSSEVVIIIDALPETPEYQVTQADCLGGNGGLAFVNAGNNLYYSRDAGEFILYTGEIPLPVGSYTFIIKYGEDGCASEEFIINIGRPQEVTITLNYRVDEPDCESLVGTIYILNSEDLAYTVTNRGTNVVYFSNVEYPVSGFGNLPPGEYLVTGTSSNGCISGSAIINLTEPNCQIAEGCTLGYWKNHTDRWCDAYETCTRYGDVFENAPTPLAELSLLEVLNLGGGGINNLGRQSVAALLNACSNEVDYELETTAEVIAYVNANFGRNRAGAAGTYLDELNNAGCPLGGTSATSAPSEGCETDEANNGNNGKPDKNDEVTTSKADFSAYPVPFKETLNIKYEFDYQSPVTIQFFDMRGQLLRTVKEAKAYNGKVTTINIDFSMRANQMYILKLTTDRDTFVKQIISGR